MSIYSREDIALLRKETLRVMRKRAVVECRIQVLEEMGELEKACRMDDEPEEAVMGRLRRLWELYGSAAALARKEVEAFERYVNASWTYQINTGKSL